MKIVKWIGISFVVLFCLGLIIQKVDPEGTKRRAQGGPVSKVFAHGFNVGFTLAKSGAVKPTSDEVDAYARQSANALNDEGGMGFKMQWKDGFWAGWNRGD